jgi:hypothetical protein
MRGRSTRPLIFHYAPSIISYRAVNGENLILFTARELPPESPQPLSALTSKICCTTTAAPFSCQSFTAPKPTAISPIRIPVNTNEEEGAETQGRQDDAVEGPPHPCPGDGLETINCGDGGSGGHGAQRDAAATSSGSIELLLRPAIPH